MIDKILSKACKLGVETEIYHSKIRSTSSSFENSKIQFLEDIFDEGVGIRVKYDGKLGFSSTCNINTANLENLFEKAIKLAKVNNANPFIEFQKTATRDRGGFKSDKIAKIPSSRILEESSDLLNQTLEKSRKAGIQPMLSGGVSKSLIEICVYNTNGVESRYEKTILSKTIYGKSNNPPSLECQVTDLTLLTEGETTGKISDEFTNKLMLSLHPRKRSKINSKLILSPPALGELLYFTIGQAVTGESMLRRRSFLFDKIGQQVASDNLSIIDWGDSNNFVSGRPFDCEGTPTRKNVIVDHGVLKQAVYDIEWGNRSGEKSTGNAHRSYYTPPFIGLNTIHIPPTAGDNLLNELGHGYYIDTITGAHTSNSVTGDFGVVVVGGYEVKNGEILYPIYGPLIASSCQTLLNSIVNVGGKEEQVLINGTAIRFSPVMIEF